MSSSADIRRDAVIRSIVTGVNETAVHYGVTNQTVARWRRELAPSVEDWRETRARFLRVVAEYDTMRNLAVMFLGLEETKCV